MIKVFDKAKWQIDKGVPKNQVLKHFNGLFNWLNDHNYLSEDGKEMLNMGIDESISLNEKMVTKEGYQFLDDCYDQYIEETQYDVTLGLFQLDKLYKEWSL